MITPRFQIKQTETDLIFNIYAPYASIADAEIYADLDIFCFYASPYYLRLHLSGHIEETDASKGSYDADTGTFVLCVQKVTKGEHFENLDFVTALLTPGQSTKRKDIKPVIEVVGNDAVTDESEEDLSDVEEEWYIDQCPFEEPSEAYLLAAPHYGFANKISGAFHNFKTEFLEIIDLPDPDKTQVFERSKLRVLQEAEDFSEDHYLADWAQPELIEPLLGYKAQWESCSAVTLSNEEIDILKDLPKKEFLLDKKEEHLVCLSLVDILFAYAYNVRSTLGENTVESAWTVNKLSATFSWLQNFSTLKEASFVPVRRSLCYPLYRHWDLSMKVLQDVKTIVGLGKQQILKSLLEVYVTFNTSEPRYLLNQLYVRDYCIWIQHVSDSRIKSLLSALSKINLSKNDIELDLEELETAAKIVALEEESYDSIVPAKKEEDSKALRSEQSLCKEIATLALSENKVSQETDTSESEDDSSSSEDEESSSSSSSLDSDDLSEEETK